MEQTANEDCEKSKTTSKDSGSQIQPNLSLDGSLDVVKNLNTTISNERYSPKLEENILKRIMEEFFRNRSSSESAVIGTRIDKTNKLTTETYQHDETDDKINNKVEDVQANSNLEVEVETVHVPELVNNPHVTGEIQCGSELDVCFKKSLGRKSHDIETSLPLTINNIDSDIEKLDDKQRLLRENSVRPHVKDSGNSETEPRTQRHVIDLTSQESTGDVTDKSHDLENARTESCRPNRIDCSGSRATTKNTSLKAIEIITIIDSDSETDKLHFDNQSKETTKQAFGQISGSTERESISQDCDSNMPNKNSPERESGFTGERQSVTTANIDCSPLNPECNEIIGSVTTFSDGEIEEFGDNNSLEVGLKSKEQVDNVHDLSYTSNRESTSNDDVGEVPFININVSVDSDILDNSDKPSNLEQNVTEIQSGSSNTNNCRNVQVVSVSSLKFPTSHSLDGNEISTGSSDLKQNGGQIMTELLTNVVAPGNQCIDKHVGATQLNKVHTPESNPEDLMTLDDLVKRYRQKRDKAKNYIERKDKQSAARRKVADKLVGLEELDKSPIDCLSLKWEIEGDGVCVKTLEKKNLKLEKSEHIVKQMRQNAWKPKIQTETKPCYCSNYKIPMNDKEGEFYIDRKKVPVSIYHQGLKFERWNPTQVLYEICLQCGWNSPDFTLHNYSVTSGFLFSVKVKDVYFLAKFRGQTKKLAKHLASTQFLYYLGFKFDFESSKIASANIFPVSTSPSNYTDTCTGSEEWVKKEIQAKQKETVKRRRRSRSRSRSRSREDWESRRLRQEDRYKYSHHNPRERISSRSKRSRSGSREYRRSSSKDPPYSSSSYRHRRSEDYHQRSRSPSPRPECYRSVRPRLDLEQPPVCRVHARDPRVLAHHSRTSAGLLMGHHMPPEPVPHWDDPRPYPQYMNHHGYHTNTGPSPEPDPHVLPPIMHTWMGGLQGGPPFNTTSQIRAYNIHGLL